MDSLELLVSFAVSAECCAPEAHHELTAFLKDRKHANMQRVRDALATLPALPHFLQGIAEANGQMAYGQRVVEAYLFGNDLLGNVTPRVIREKVLRPFAKQGLPGTNSEVYSQALELNAHGYQGIPATHTFDVLLNVAREWQQGRVRLEILNDTSLQCQVSWGEVRRLGKRGLEVEEHRYAAGTTEQGLPGFLHEPRTTTRDGKKISVDYDQALLRGTKPGSLVAIHHDTAFAPLSEDQRNNLALYAQRAAALANAWIATYGSRKAPLGKA